MARNLNPENYANLAIEDLNYACRGVLSPALNVIQQLPSGAGVPADFRGAAELRGFTYTDIQNFQQSPDPTDALLCSWNSYGLGEADSSVKSLLEILIRLGRRDILTKLEEPLRKNLEAQRQRASWVPPEQVNIVSSAGDECPNIAMDDIILYGDGDGRKVMKDAFFAFADPDAELALRMANIVEKPPYNLKLLIPRRDILARGLQCDLMARSIMERCRTVMVLLSKSSENSEMVHYLVQFAHCLSPSSRYRSLIPIILDPGVTIPPVLLPQNKLYYNDPLYQGYFWRNLTSSIRTAPAKMNSIVSKEKLDSISMRITRNEVRQEERRDEQVCSLQAEYGSTIYDSNNSLNPTATTITPNNSTKFKPDESGMAAAKPGVLSALEQVHSHVVKTYPEPLYPAVPTHQPHEYELIPLDDHDIDVDDEEGRGERWTILTKRPKEDRKANQLYFS